MSMLTLWRNANIATFAGAAAYGWTPDACLVTDGAQVRWVGASCDLPREFAFTDATERDLGGACVTPGLIDCHTHLVYAGNRAREFELRLTGATYEEIARAGGGIRSTVAATRPRATNNCLSTPLAVRVP